MRAIYLLLFISFVACNPFKTTVPKVGDCYIGTKMDVWKLLRMDDGKFLFATFPFDENSPVEILNDISALKKVDCPL